MNRRIFNFFLLVMFFGIASSVSATTYRLQRVTSVENGGKYVFEQAGYVMTNTLSDGALQASNSFNTTELTGSENYVWNLSSYSGGYTIKNGNYLRYANNSTNLELNSSANSYAAWTFSFQPDGTALITTGTGISMRTLCFSKSTLQEQETDYRCYPSGDLGFQPHSIVVYKLVEEVEGKQRPGIVFNDKFEKLLKGSVFTSHPLSKATAFEGSIVYTSSNTDVATVNGNGEVNIVGSGHALITASSDASDDFDAGEATYTIVVMDGDGTESKPFSVKDFYSGFLGPDNSYVWAQGYIVGGYNKNSTIYEYQESATTDTYFSLADKTEGVNSSNVVPVEYSSFGLYSHPDLKNCKVLLYGRIGRVRYKTSLNSVSSALKLAYGVTISKYKYATYRTTEKLDFTGTGVSAYTAAIDGNNVKLTKISDGVVDTGLGVVLYSGTARTYDIPVTAVPATVTNTGLLISDGSTATKEANTYVLGKKNDVVGFYRWIGAGSLPAGRVYLNGGAIAARDYLEFAFDDEATGMRDAVHHDKVEIRTDVVYDLQGRRVAQPGKGLYIVNGKKIVIK